MSSINSPIKEIYLGKAQAHINTAIVFLFNGSPGLNISFKRLPFIGIPLVYFGLQEMGQGTPGGLNRQAPGDRKSDGDKKKDKKYEPAAPPTRVGRKQRKQKGPEAAARLPTVTPHTKCRLRLLKLERVKDYLLMEEEFVTNQERLKPQEEKAEEDRSKVDDLRGSPMSVGNLEELIDENHAIVSSSVGPEYYVGIMSFVDKDQLEPGCAILMHNKV